MPPRRRPLRVPGRSTKRYQTTPSLRLMLQAASQEGSVGYMSAARALIRFLGFAEVDDAADSPDFDRLSLMRARDYAYMRGWYARGIRSCRRRQHEGAGSRRRYRHAQSRSAFAQIIISRASMMRATRLLTRLSERRGVGSASMSVAGIAGRSRSRARSPPAPPRLYCLSLRKRKPKESARAIDARLPRDYEPFTCRALLVSQERKDDGRHAASGVRV